MVAVMQHKSKQKVWQNVMMDEALSKITVFMHRNNVRIMLHCFSAVAR
jgi:hypothetical protein